MIPSLVDLELLRSEIVLLDYKTDSTGVLMANGQSRGLGIIKNKPGLVWAIQDLVRARGQHPLHVMVNIIPPGIRVPKHVDHIDPTKHQPIAPTVERWHLPITTNALATLNGVHLPAGFWHGPIEYWKPHWVENQGGELRVHLIVDLDTVSPMGSY